MKIAVLQHVPFEGPATIADWANSRGHQLYIINLFNGDAMPSISEFDALIVMGGPMSIHDEVEYPWLVDEKAFIRHAIDEGKHVLGICLGAQLVADTLGGDVTRNAHREIGWFPIQREGTHALSKHFDDLLAFHWHGDTFSIPAAAERIASSEGCANQAFVFHDRVLALQFHLELTPEIVKRLIVHCAEDIDGGPYSQTAEAMMKMPMRFAKVHQALYRLMDEWLNSRPQ